MSYYTGETFWVPTIDFHSKTFFSLVGQPPNSLFISTLYANIFIFPGIQHFSLQTPFCLTSEKQIMLSLHLSLSLSQSLTHSSNKARGGGIIGNIPQTPEVPYYKLVTSLIKAVKINVLSSP